VRKLLLLLLYQEFNSWYQLHAQQFINLTKSRLNSKTAFHTTCDLPVCSAAIWTACLVADRRRMTVDVYRRHVGLSDRWAVIATSICRSVEFTRQVNDSIIAHPTLYTHRIKSDSKFRWNGREWSTNRESPNTSHLRPLTRRLTSGDYSTVDGWILA